MDGPSLLFLSHSWAGAIKIIELKLLSHSWDRSYLPTSVATLLGKRFKASEAQGAGLPPFTCWISNIYKYQLRVVSPRRKVSTVSVFFLLKQVAWLRISPLVYCYSTESIGRIQPKSYC